MVQCAMNLEGGTCARDEELIVEPDNDCALNLPDADNQVKLTRSHGQKDDKLVRPQYDW